MTDDLTENDRNGVQHLLFVGGYGVDEFAYGYALTAHKAEGSRWGNVVVVDERYCFEEPSRWLYTAVTRAKESVVILTQHG